MPVGLPPPRAPNCLACRHFLVTWEPEWPRGCRVFGIKTRGLPSAEVFAATGTHCPAFEPAEPRKRPEPAPPGEAGPDGDGDGGIWA